MRKRPLCPMSISTLVKWTAKGINRFLHSVIYQVEQTNVSQYFYGEQIWCLSCWPGQTKSFKDITLRSWMLEWSFFCQVSHILCYILLMRTLPHPHNSSHPSGLNTNISQSELLKREVRRSREGCMWVGRAVLPWPLLTHILNIYIYIFFFKWNFK